jgi:hypothetical protein
MQSYAMNSPEAMAAIVAMAMIVDADIDDREIEALERFSIYTLLEISSERFAEVFEENLDLLAGVGPGDDVVSTVNVERLDSLLDLVDEPEKQVLLGSIIYKIILADQQIHEAEALLFNHVLNRWNLKPSDLGD